MPSLSVLETIVKSLTSVASAVSFLFSGASFGCIPSIKIDATFAISCTRGCGIICILYYIASVIYCFEENVHPDEMYIFAAFIWAANLVTIGLIDADKESWSLLIWPTNLLLAIQVSVSAYYVITDSFLQNDQYININAVLLVHFIFSLFLLMIFSVIPFTLMGDQARNVGLSIWSWEYCDCISHILVSILYAKRIETWDPTLKAYFVFFNFNMYLWIIPTYWTITEPKISGMHLIVIDIITDVPMLLVIAATYKDNIYISMDIAVKTIVLLRGCIYIPIRTYTDAFQVRGIWHRGFNFKKSDLEYERVQGGSHNAGSDSAGSE